MSEPLEVPIDGAIAPPDADLTALLDRTQRGDARANDELFVLVYEELRRVADRCLAEEARGQTLQPTALVHEAYLRLIGGSGASWRSRAHFFHAAARAIRRILIDRARARRRERRGGGARRLSLDAAQCVAVDGPSFDVLELDEALERLAELDPQKARIVELRFFGGLDVDETARTLRVSASTVARDWRFSRTWLHRELSSHAKS
jgi:RNA polymerase sigma factor (TIGR02999 family)